MTKKLEKTSRMLLEEVADSIRTLPMSLETLVGQRRVDLEERERLTSTIAMLTAVIAKQQATEEFLRRYIGRAILARGKERAAEVPRIGDLPRSVPGFIFDRLEPRR